MLHEREPNMMVDRLNLIEKLRTNRAKHAQCYEEMCKGYMVMVDDANEEFQQMLREEFASKAPQDVDHEGLFRKAFRKVGKPSQHFKDYDDAIEMLEWIEEDKVRISLSQFRMWVRDEWSWFGSFIREGELPLANSDMYESKFKA